MDNYFYRKLVFAKLKSGGGATYTAGTNIEITEDNVINNTIPYDDVTKDWSISLGKSLNTGTQIDVACTNLGFNTSTANSTNSVVVGAQAQAIAAPNCVSIGSRATSVGNKSCVTLGYRATTTKPNQFVLGSTDAPINEMKVVTSEGDKYIATTDQTVPTGGTKGQVLMKNSDTDYDFSWTSLADYDEVSF